jgi:predicted component of type VI protein secretion system
MIRTPKAFLIAAALLVAVAACSRTDGVTAPERARLDVQAPTADSTTTTTQSAPASPPDATPPDTTGRYGGSLGSGT